MIYVEPASLPHCDLIHLESNELKVIVTNYGCHILSVMMPDQHGDFSDVVLGYQTLEEYQSDDKGFGALIGRFANRIKKGKFCLNDKEYTLAINNGPNHIHGGIEGFDKKVFDYYIEDNKVIFEYFSKDGEEGYPGNLTLQVTYTLEKDTLHLDYHATSDQDTLINITNHSYFNLCSSNTTIHDQELMIQADQIACIDEDGLPTDEFIDVKGTPFDFNHKKTIGSCLNDKHPQLTIGKGLDHPYKLSASKDQVVVYDAHTKRKLTMSTTLPYAQIYSANYIEGVKGKNGVNYHNKGALCIETEYLPDGIHLEKEPQCILKKGENYDAKTSYRFEVIK